MLVRTFASAVTGIDAVTVFNGKKQCTPVKVDLQELFAIEANKYDVDFSDVRGQENVKRALEVAAAGGHNVITLYAV